MGDLKRLLVIYLCVMITVPALWTLVHGEAEVNENAATTPDVNLRQNEGIASKTDDEVISREEEAINSEGLSVKERRLLEESGEKHAFQAEVNKMMNIIINSLYSNSEIFLREVISNASDAIDKIRFLSLTNPQLLDAQPELKIMIKADPDAKTLTISDTGIGMTKEQLITNLGTIAKSGTTDFLKNYQAGGDTSMIGQFGVGFYSVFLVADKVTVISKNNEDKQHIWISDAQSSFSISEDPRGDTLGRGTSIVLHLKDEAEDFLAPERIRGLVSKYSEFINYPIYFWSSENVVTEVEKTEEEIAEERRKKKGESENEDETVSLDEEEKPEDDEEIERTKKVSSQEWDYRLMNSVKPLWTRSPKDVTTEEYNKFYEAISKGDTEEPLMHIHFLAEGEIEFKSLLYIPARATSNAYDRRDQGKGLKLYVRRVFITDEFKDILPKYLAFIKGVVDSDGLPLNVSREMLQENKTLKIIKKKIVRKAIAMFQQLSEETDTEKYNQFWQNYGSNIKLGVIEDPTNKQRLSQLMMFQSSATGQLSTLQKYVDRMKEGQKQIYFLACERLEECKTSPLAEKLVSKGYEIMYMSDPIDEYTINSMERFDGKYKLTNVGKEGLEIDGIEDEEEQRKAKETYAGLKEWLKEKLSTLVEKVVVTTRLVTAPAALVSGTWGWTANMERLHRAQALADPKAAQMNAPKKVLEINPDHVLIKELNRRYKENGEDPVAIEMAEMLYETAALTSGFDIAYPARFVSQVLKMMTKSFSESLPSEVVEEMMKAEPIKAPQIYEEQKNKEKDTMNSHEEL